MADLADDLTATDPDDILEQAQGVVRRYCGWHIAPVRTAETYRVQRLTAAIALPTLHLVSIESIDDGLGSTFVENVDYLWTEAGVLTRRCGVWLRGTVVTFTHGYATVPADVTGVVQAVARRPIANPESLLETQTGPYTSVYGPRTGQLTVLSLTQSERAVLDPYRLRLL